MEQIKIYLANIRSDEGFNILEKIKKMMRPYVSSLKYCWTQNEKRSFDECKDEATKDQNDQFKTNFYYVILDTALSKLEKRFKLMNNMIQCSIFPKIYIK